MENTETGACSTKPDTVPGFKLNKESAEAIAILIAAGAPHVNKWVEEYSTSQREQRADATAHQNENRRIDKRVMFFGITLQVLIVATVATGGIAAAWMGQWPIAEKVMFGLLGLGFGARMGR